jgi:putative OPT family oligopeptide transporter
MTEPATPAAQPYIAASTVLPEMTARALIVGTLLGMVFGASSLYLVLKVGLTVSASIPVAVISITLFKLLHKLKGRDATILENNLSQTAGSAGESLAFGVGVTMPAILILGFDLELMRVLLVAVLGGLLGILMMIPLRHALIVRQHGTLKYPEGTACAEVLKAGASEESRAAAAPNTNASEQIGGISAATIFTGFGIGLVYKSLMVAFKAWRDVPSKVFGAPYNGGSVATEVSPELLGVGYIIGPRIAAIMFAGGVLSYMVLIPLIKAFGEGMPAVFIPGAVPIVDMSPNQIRSAYILYIGAGAVAAGGIISLFKSLPIIVGSLRRSFGDFGAESSGQVSLRTEKDLSMRFVFFGLAVLIVAIMLAPPMHMNLFGALLIVVFGFLFVTVSSRLAGEVGTSSNPISGMTVATLLLTCGLFLVIGWTSSDYYVTALSVGGIVCVAASSGGATSQDLKTGFLVGATPRYQQIAILVGSFASAVILGPILLQLNDSATVYVPIAQIAPSGLHVDAQLLSEQSESLQGPQARDDAHRYRVWHKTDSVGAPQGKYLVTETGQAVWLVDPGINGVYSTRPDGSEVRKLDAPKAVLMSYIIKGVLDRELPWGLVLLGAMFAIAAELAAISSLPFAVGVYLPLSTSSAIFVGGAIRWLVDRQLRKQLAHRNLDEAQFQAEADRSAGVLLASGYIAGGAIAGIVVAFMAGVLDQTDAALNTWAKANNPFFAGPYADALALIPFAIMVTFLWLVGRGSLLAGKSAR